MCIQYVINFIKSKKGATAIEYGLIVGGISIVIMVSVFAMGSDLGSMFSFIAGKMEFINTKAQ